MYDEALSFDQLALGIAKRFADTGNGSIEISATALPKLAKSYVTQSIVVKKRYHYYDYFYRAESLEFFLSRSDCEGLALALLAVVMHAGDSFTLHVRHPDSEIRSLRVPPPRSELNGLGLHYLATKFVYSPTDAMADPAARLRTSDKPVFKLCPSTPHIEPADWEKRDRIEIAASDVGLLVLARMLLNLGRGPANLTELELAWFAGTNESSLGPGSAEARFWLPGSIARDD